MLYCIVIVSCFHGVAINISSAKRWKYTTTRNGSYFISKFDLTICGSIEILVGENDVHYISCHVVNAVHLYFY